MTPPTPPDRTVENIRAAMKTALDGLTGPSGQPYNVVQYNVAPVFATICFFPDELIPHEGAALQKWTWIVQAYIGGLDITAQQALDTLINPNGDGSLQTALEADPTLGGVVDDLIVTSNKGHQLFRVPQTGADVLGSTWTVLMVITPDPA
jgi:hypothetical protein